MRKLIVSYFFLKKEAFCINFFALTTINSTVFQRVFIIIFNRCSLSFCHIVIFHQMIEN